MRSVLQPRFIVGVLLIGLAAGGAALLGGGALQSPTQAQGSSVTLQVGGNNIVYQGDALPVLEALNDAAPGVAAVWLFDGPSQRWLLWNPSLPAPLQGFSTLEPGQAYWVEAISATLWTFPAAGGISSGATGSVSLSPGFNNVAYGGSSQPILDALGDTASVVTSIWSFHAVSQQWQLWSSALPGPLQAFTTLEPGQAYWLVADSAAEWRAGARLGPPPLPPELVVQAEAVLATFAQTSPDLSSIETALRDIVGFFAAATTNGHHPATVLRAIQMALPQALNAEGDVDASIEALMAIDQAWNAQATVFGPDGLTVAAAEPFRRELSVYFINGVLNTAAGGATTAATLSTLLDVPVTHIYNWSFFNGSDYRQIACARAVVDSFADTALVNAICGGIDGIGTLAGQGIEVFGGFIGGVIQTTLQRFFDFDLISSAVNDKLVPMLQADLLAGKAVIVMGHSQGTMFTRNALDRVRRWWAEQRDDGLVTGDPPIGALLMSPAFTTSENDTERYVRLPTDILGVLMVTGSEPTTMLEDSQAWSFPVVGNLFVHMLDTYLEEGTASLREIRSDFAHLRDFLTRDFEGGTPSGVGCTSGGFTWDVNLTQTFADVRGTISFHACPGGGRATYQVRGSAPLGAQIVELQGTKFSTAGGLGQDTVTPRIQTFFVERDGEPDPNFVKRVDLEIFATSVPETVLVDGNVTYELEILNRGPDRATDIEVTVGLRDGFGTFVSSSVPCESAPEGIVCTLGQTLPENARTTVTVTYRALFSGTFIIDVGVRSTTGGDTNDRNNNKTTSTEVIDPDE